MQHSQGHSLMGHITEHINGPIIKYRDVYTGSIQNKLSNIYTLHSSRLDFFEFTFDRKKPLPSNGKEFLGRQNNSLLSDFLLTGQNYHLFLDFLMTLFLLISFLLDKTADFLIIKQSYFLLPDFFLKGQNYFL